MLLQQVDWLRKRPGWIAMLAKAVCPKGVGPALRLCEGVGDAALSESVDAVLFAGDTFDSGVADVASRAALATELSRLARAGIPAVLIQGNHDALLDLDRYGPISTALTVLTPDAPTFRIGEASIHGLGFTATHMAGSLLPRYPRPEPGRYNIGLMHTSLDGAAGHDPYPSQPVRGPRAVEIAQAIQPTPPFQESSS